MDAMTVAAASGMRARMESLEMLANNLANAATAGYKSDREFYSLYISPEAGDPLSPATLPVIERHWTDFSEGAFTATGNPLDLAIAGRGFFAADGPSGRLFTRNGGFQVSAAGVLVTTQGYPVRAVGGGTIQVDPNAPLEVAADGTVSQNGVALGQLEIVDFPDASVLRKQEGGYFAAPGGQGGVAASGYSIRQGRLEGSNVNTAEAAVRLVSVLRQFEMLQRAVALASEMNRKAVEEVARVG